MQCVDVIADILKREGIEYLMGFPRTPLIEAAAKLGIRPILCRQERIGVSVADGYSRTTAGRRIGVFVAQHGPGTENAFPGVAQSFAENVPILVLPGGEATSRQFTRPLFSAVDNYRHVTKWLARADSADRVPELMRRAFHNLRTGKLGPVLIEIPRDVWEAECSGDIDYVPVRGHRSAPDPADVDAAAAALVAARAPVILAGQGVMYAEAHDALVELAELLQAPVMTTNPGKSVFPEDHDLSLGAALSRSMPGPVHSFLNAADCVFAIGSSLTRTNFGPAVPDGKSIIHATNDAGDINKDYRVDVAMIGDATLVLDALIAAVADRLGGTARAERAAEVLAAREKWLGDWMAQLASDETPINPYRVLWDLLNTVDGDNVIATHDSGSPREQMLPFWRAVRPRSYMGWGKSTQLGHGLGLIMGAKLAEPGKLCVNVMGDAAIGMVGMDIETAARNSIATLTLVFNNGVMAAERDSMIVAHERFGALTQGGNYAAVADALGAAAERIERPGDIVPALKRAIDATESGQPALVEFITKEGYDFSRFD